MRSGGACVALVARLALRTLDALRPLGPLRSLGALRTVLAIECAAVGVVPDTLGHFLGRLCRILGRRSRRQDLVHQRRRRRLRIHAGRLRAPLDPPRVGVDGGDHKSPRAVGTVDADGEISAGLGQHLRRHRAGVAGDQHIHRGIAAAENGGLAQTIPLLGEHETDLDPDRAGGDLVVRHTRRAALICKEFDHRFLLTSARSW